MTQHRTNGTHADPEVLAKPSRRVFDAAFKRRILALADQIEADGGVLGAMLRKEGLYRSQLSDWRRARAERGDAALVAQKRGRKPAASTSSASSKPELARLNRRIASLEKKLLQAESIIDIQKKVAALAIQLDSIDEDVTT